MTKKIVLLPTKNEEWIIDTFLKNVSWADLVIIANQHSIDKTRDIARTYPNVILIDNPYEGHSNKVRWLLLDYLKQKLAELSITQALVFCLDADEILTQDALHWTQSTTETLLAHGAHNIQFVYPWFQMCESMHTYRIDGVWKKSAQMAAFFLDTNKTLPDYVREEIVNDHTTRIPTYPENILVERMISPFPILHLQFLAITRTQLKQAWYMCRELINGHKNAKRINRQYSESIHLRDIVLRHIDKTLLKDITLPPPEIRTLIDPLRLADIIEIYMKHGILHFEPLDIWHINELREIFIKEIGRKPNPQTYPAFVLWLEKWMPKSLKTVIKWCLRHIIR